MAALIRQAHSKISRIPGPPTFMFIDLVDAIQSADDKAQMALKFSRLVGRRVEWTRRLGHMKGRKHCLPYTGANGSFGNWVLSRE